MSRLCLITVCVYAVCSDQDTQLYDSIKEQARQQSVGWIASEAAPATGDIGATQALLSLCYHIRSAHAHGTACVLTHPAMDPCSADIGLSDDVREVHRLLACTASSCISPVADTEAFTDVKVGDCVIVHYSDGGATVYTGKVVAIRSRLAPIAGVQYVWARPSRGCKHSTADPSLDFKIRYAGWGSSADAWHGGLDVQAVAGGPAERHEMGICTCTFKASRLLVPAYADTSSALHIMSIPRVCLALRQPDHAIQFRDIVAFCSVVQVQYGAYSSVAFIVDPCTTDADISPDQVSVLKDGMISQASACMVLQFVPTVHGGWILLTVDDSGRIVVGDSQRSVSDRRRMCRDLQLHMIYARRVKEASTLQGAVIPPTSALRGWYSDIPDTSADDSSVIDSDSTLRLLLLVLALVDSLNPLERLANRADLLACIRSPWSQSTRLQIRRFLMTCILCGFIPCRVV